MNHAIEVSERAAAARIQGPRFERTRPLAAAAAYADAALAAAADAALGDARSAASS